MTASSSLIEWVSIGRLIQKVKKCWEKLGKIMEFVRDHEIRISRLEAIVGVQPGTGRRPGPINVTFTGEDHMAGQDTILFEANLIPLTGLHDVVSRELKVMVDGALVEIKTAAPTDTVVTGLRAPQDSTVRLELVDIDDAGNRSELSSHEFAALDTFKPNVPGELGATRIGEEYGQGSADE